MKVKLHKYQYEIATDPHRFKVICAGRRFGKSVLARLMVLKWSVEKPGLYWLVSPTYQQGKDIHFYQGFKKEIPTQLVEKWNEAELSVTLTNGSVIALKSAENPDRLKGVKLRGLVVDEVASMRNWAWIWEEALRPTLTDYEAPAIFISTPKGYNFFYDLFNMQDRDYKSFRYTSYDNPYIPKQEIDKAKEEVSEDYFAQEYLADFRQATGLVHKLWDRGVHLIETFEIPQDWQVGRGFDYGSAHPTASLKIRTDNDDNWFIERCYKQAGRTIKDHAEAIKAQDYGQSLSSIFGDPSGAQWEKEFAEHGLYITQANKEIGQGSKGWVEFCVEKVNERLKSITGHTVYLPDGRKIENAPKLFVLNTPENQSIVKEFELLKWRETANKERVSVLDEDIDPFGHFDLLACLRYFAVSYKKQEKWTAPKSDISRANWSLT